MRRSIPVLPWDASSRHSKDTPGAAHLACNRIVTGNHPVHGLLTDPEVLAQTLSEHGVGNRSHVVQIHYLYPPRAGIEKQAISFASITDNFQALHGGLR
jgi:hypothetical protein